MNTSRLSRSRLDMLILAIIVTLLSTGAFVLRRIHTLAITDGLPNNGRRN